MKSRVSARQGWAGCESQSTPPAIRVGGVGGQSVYVSHSQILAVTVCEERKEKMRIWDISPKRLCRNHLLGEHRELHAIWSVLVNGKKGYAHHPETLRWRGRLRALFGRHDALVQEMAVRGYQHRSPLPKSLARGSAIQRAFVATKRAQVEILRKKRCRCDV